MSVHPALRLDFSFGNTVIILDGFFALVFGGEFYESEAFGVPQLVPDNPQSSEPSAGLEQFLLL